MSFLSAGVLGVGEALEGAARVQRKVASDVARLNSERQRFSGMGAAAARSGLIKIPIKTPKTPPKTKQVVKMPRPANPPKNRLRGLGTSPNITQGTRAWWNWYATQYLPKYYTPGQVQQYITASPYYVQYGSPYNYGVGVGINPGQYPNQYPAQPATYYPPAQTYYPPAQYQYPYSYNQYGYQTNPYYQAEYTQGVSQQGAYACQQQGGYWDYAQQSCNGGYGPYGWGSQPAAQFNPSTQPPNVIGMSESQAISILNAAGFNVWELSRDGISQGVPPGYSANRVSISVANGMVNASAVG